MHYFTDEEDKLIRELYPIHGDKTWLMMPTRSLYSAGALRQRARRIGINSINQQHPWNLSRDDAIYFAGIIDGEGSIMLEQQSGGRPYYIPRVSVYNTNYRLMEWLLGIIEPIPRCITKPPTSRKSHWKTSYQMDIRGVGAVYSVLVKITPFLKLKDEHAKLLLEYCEGRIGKRKRSGMVSEREREIFQRIKELNRRGNITL